MEIIRSSRQPLKIFTGFFISRRQPLDHFIIEPAISDLTDGDIARVELRLS